MTNEELAVAVRKHEPWATLELWEGVKRFVYARARSRALLLRGGVCFDDLVQDGFLSMLDAAERFDPERGGSFLSVLTYDLQKRFDEECGIRSSKRDALQYASSIEEPLYDAADPDGVTVADALEDPAGEYAFSLVDYDGFRSYVRRLIFTAMEPLTETQVDTIRRYFFDGLTMEEASRYGRQSASQNIERGLRYMRRGKYRRELREALEGFEDFHSMPEMSPTEYAALHK